MTLRSHPLVKQGLDRYRGLSSRDRSVLQLLAVIVGLLLIYSLVWIPADRFLANSQDERNRHFDLLRYMQGTEAQARAVTGVTSGLAGQTLLSQISSSTANFQIKPNRLQPEGSDAVSVWFDSVSFNNLIRWLEQQSQQGINVRQISIDKGEAQGTVSARVILHT